MTLKNAFLRVLDNGIERYHKPELWEICGIKIYFKPCPSGVSAEEWRDVLEEWLPRYEKVGWLNGLNGIYIGNGVAEGDATARYNHRGSIDLENSFDIPPSYLAHSGAKESVLTHEMIHHAHITLNGFEKHFKPSERAELLKTEVSWYAGKDIGESVAEIGTGIVFGEEYPDWVHKYYDNRRGPQEVYEIAKEIR